MIFLEEQFLIEYYMKKHLILLTIRYQCGFGSMVYKYFDKKPGIHTVTRIISKNQQLAELLKPIAKRFNKSKRYCYLKTSFGEGRGGGDLADI